VNQLVWLYWPRPVLRQRTRKLTCLWSGPWKILSFRTSIVVVIQHTQTGKRQTVHIDRLSPCFTPPRDLTSAQAAITNTASVPAVLVSHQHQASTTQPFPRSTLTAAATASTITTPARPVRTKRKPARLID